MGKFLYEKRDKYTQVTIGTACFGDGEFSVIAGPCAVESEEMLSGLALSLKSIGADVLRGGAFKPRTSPYSFQGLELEGLCILERASKAAGIPIVTEVMDVLTLKHFKNVDAIQIGSRNMQNYPLLKAVGKYNKPVILKRGSSATIEEFLKSAEYILAEGNPNVILCERGIRTFSDITRYTLDLTAVPLLKSMTHLPVIVDPSHGTGIASLVPAMSKAAVAAGADGLMIEVHNTPNTALSDGEQSITPDQFEDMINEIRNIRAALIK